MASLREAGPLLRGAARAWRPIRARPATLFPAGGPRRWETTPSAQHQASSSPPYSTGSSQQLAEDPYPHASRAPPQPTGRSQQPGAKRWRYPPPVKIRPTPVTMLSTPESVASLVDTILALPKTRRASLYMELEGQKVAPHGTISFGTLSFATIYVMPAKHVYLIDIHALQEAAFETPGRNGTTTLRTILESRRRRKGFFDVRSHAEALYARFGIDLQGVEDVQLMECAARPPGGRRFLHGLETCIMQAPSRAVRDYAFAWRAVMARAARRFDPAEGGTWAAFFARPLDPHVERFCANQVVYLPLLRKMYMKRLDEELRQKVREQSAARVREARDGDYATSRTKKSWSPWV